MPRTKNPDKYPTHYRPLMLAAYAAKEKGVKVPCDDMRHAHRLRRHLYAFAAAVAHHEDQVKMPHEMRDGPRLHLVMITIESGVKPALKLINRNYTPENLAVARIVEAMGEAAQHTDEDLAERSLAEQIIAAADRGDFAEVERLEALASGTDEPGQDPEPQPEDDSDFARFLAKP